MPCCKADKYKWCEDRPIVYVDEKGREYCVFHAPKGKKSITLEKFNEIILNTLWDCDSCNLSGTVFEGDIDFRTLERETRMPTISFSEAEFHGKVELSGVHFDGSAVFSNARFQDQAEFRDAKFAGKVDFGAAKFNGAANFSRVQFKGKATFTDAVFSAVGDFRATAFSEEADFGRSQFSEEADFRHAEFDGRANFWQAIFRQEANLEATEFAAKVDFQVTHFMGYANFSAAQFAGDTTFWRTRFLQRTDFTSALIEKHLRFEKISINKICFADTDVRKIDFVNCDWSRKNGRRIIYDEKNFPGVLPGVRGWLKALWRLPEEREGAIRKAETVYRKLKQRCEEDHNPYKASPCQ